MQGQDDGGRILMQKEVATEEDRLDSSSPSMVSQVMDELARVFPPVRSADIFLQFQ